MTRRVFGWTGHCGPVHERVAFEGEASRHLEAVRARCLAYPEALEVEQFGYPWFKAGKRPFAIFGLVNPDDASVGALSFAASRDDQDALCHLDPRFRPTPYMHQHGWTTLELTGTVDWGLIDELLESAYRRVALKRMLTTLDGGG